MRRLLLGWLLCLLVWLALCFPLGAQAAPPEHDDAAIGTYYDAWLKQHPLDATELGVHTYDHALPHLDEKSLTTWATELRVLRRNIAVTTSDCTLTCQIDQTIVLRRIDAELFEIEELRPLDRWPDAWVSEATAAVFPLVKRNFAPPEERARAVADRLTALPALLKDARAHLLGKRAMVAPIAVDIAIEDLRGAIEFIDNDVPEAFGFAPGLDRAKVRTGIDASVAALRDFEKFLDSEVRPKAKAPISIGPKLLAKKLLLEEMIDEPFAPLLARGEAELKRLQTAFHETAHAIDPKQDGKVALAALGKDHAAPQDVIPEAQGRLMALRKFLVDKKIVTIPSEVMPIVDETPPFMRAMTQASMDSPGPFETVAHEAFFHITLPDPSWPAHRIEDYLAGALSRPRLDVVSIHETFPGHYLQFLWVPKLTSRVRKMAGTSSNVEGWAHYSEQMMLDAGWDADKPIEKLAQLSDALLRAARYVVALRMHGKGITVAQAQKVFTDDAYQSSEVARVEAKRATEDPTFLYYTWGKLQLLALRKDCEQKWGDKYTLQRFHDTVMAEGPIPLPLLRKAILAQP